MRRANAVVFLSKAYERSYIQEDILLLLTAVNESAKQAGKPAFLKATAVGMGFFAQVNCEYDISHHLYPYYLRAFRDLLATGLYPHIAEVEFPLFSDLFEQFYNGIFITNSYGGVRVSQSRRDVLKFSEEECDKYYLCVVNPSDANALPGNEWTSTSVEASIGNNTSLRFDQVYLMNPEVLNSANFIPVEIDQKNFRAEIKAAEISIQPPKP